MTLLTRISAKSLEQYTNRHLLLLVLPLLLLTAALTWLLALPWWAIMLSEFIVLVYAYYISQSIKEKTLVSFQRASLQLDAIAQDDYKLYAKASFEQGQVAYFHQQLNDVSAQLQLKKSRYDQHVFLVYQLIGQLDAPILVFNAKQQLTFANDAFYQLRQQPWQLFRHASPQLLGITKQDGQWRFQFNQSTNTNEVERWQINQSEFIDADEQHLLLVFVDIQSALRASQLNAWQQVIRVLGHEIRNSLTPVSSMAETLTDKTSNERDKKALTVITERCMHLQSFVERYASLSKQLTIDYQSIAVVDFFTPLIALYHSKKFTVQLDSQVEIMTGDRSFLSQVFINLLKNAQEAEATEVFIRVSVKAVAKLTPAQITKQRTSSKNLLIEVIDNGHGFSNLSNLFVPLYSTKEQGQGIGLSFCRNIIEQHHGSINLVNNSTEKPSKRGVTLIIELPLVLSN